MFSDADVAEVRHVVQRILVPCVFVIGLLGNSVSIYVLTRKRMRCTTNIYLTALAITDIIYLTLILLLSLQHYEYIQQNCVLFYKLYGVFVWLVDACAYISIYIAVCFTIERFIAIRYPLKRQTFCTESLAKKVIAGVALFCLLSTISTQFEHTYEVSYMSVDSDGQQCNETMANVTPMPSVTMMTAPATLTTTTTTTIATSVGKIQTNDTRTRGSKTTMTHLRRLPVTGATMSHQSLATLVTPTPILTTELQRHIDDWLWPMAGSGYGDTDGDLTLSIIDGAQLQKHESIVMPSERRFMTRQTPEAVILSDNNNVYVAGNDDDDDDDDDDDENISVDDIDMPLSTTLSTLNVAVVDVDVHIANVALTVSATELRQVADIPNIVTTTQSFDKQQDDNDVAAAYDDNDEDDKTAKEFKLTTTTTATWPITMAVSGQLSPTELPTTVERTQAKATTTTIPTITRVADKVATLSLHLQRRALQQQQQHDDHNIQQAIQAEQQHQQQREELERASSVRELRTEKKQVVQEQPEYDNGTFAFNITEYCQNVTVYKNIASNLGENALYNHIWSLYTMFVFVLIPLMVLATFNCILIMLVRRSKNLRSDLTNANSIRRVKRKSTTGNSTISQENRVTVTLIAVVLLFIVCQLPWAIYLIISQNMKIDWKFQAIIGNIFNLLAAINAASNFFLYCVLSDKYRKTVRELITGYRRRHRHAQHNASLYTTASTYANGSRRFRNSTSMSILTTAGAGHATTGAATTATTTGGKANAGALIT